MTSVVLYLDRNLHRFAYVPDAIPVTDVLSRLQRDGYDFLAGRSSIPEPFGNSERRLLTDLTMQLDRMYALGKNYAKRLEEELDKILPGSVPIAKPL